MRHLCPPQSEHRLVDVLDHPEEADEQMAGRALLQNYWSFGLEIKSSERGQALKVARRNLTFGTLSDMAVNMAVRCSF